MKRGLIAAILAAMAPACALAGAPVRLQARDTVSLPYPGALAVFAVDPSTVETSTQPGGVVLHARRAGDTLVTIVLPDGQDTVSVHVDPAAPLLLPGQAGRNDEAGAVEISHDTGTQRTDAHLGLQLRDGDRSASLRIDALHGPTIPTTSHTALPFASLALESPREKLVLLDDLVQESPLTLDGRVLRGLHWSADGFALHAGVVSDQPFGDLLVPGSGERAVGLSWRRPVGSVVLVPHLLWLPDSASSARAVTSLDIEGAAADRHWTYRVGLGWGGRPGAALDVDLHEGERQFWTRAVVRPRGFASLSSVGPPGSWDDTAWTEPLGERTTATLTASVAQLQLPEGDPLSASGGLELRHQVATHWSMSAAGGSALYRDPTQAEVRRQVVSVGGAYDTAAAGASMLLRYQQTAAGGGAGARFSSRADVGGWRATVFVDVQQQAPTLDLLLLDRPDLRRALADLGLADSDPEEVLRILRDHPELLAARGVTLGPLHVSPLRWQSGLDLSWQGGPRQARFGFRAAAERQNGMAASRGSTLATLYASWHVTRDTELTVGYTHWEDRASGQAPAQENSVQLALRTSLSPDSWPGIATRAITGEVVYEDDKGERPAAGVDVVLDHGRRTTTDSAGRFVFERPGTGMHRVEAMLPSFEGAAFTSGSVRSIASGGTARFGLRLLEARLAGVIRNDAGQPIPGVRLRVGAPASVQAVSDSSGGYVLALPAGDARVAIDPDSLPPGYELATLAPQSVHVAPRQPRTLDFTVRAQRAVQGQVHGTGAAHAVITVEETGRATRADADGGFVLRGLPAGHVTLRVETGRGTRRGAIDLPDGPALLRDVSLSAP